MLKLRILTAVVVLPVFVAAIFLLPNEWWSIALMVPLLVAGHEWARLSGFDRNTELVFLATLMAGCALLWIIVNHGVTRPQPASFAVYRTVYAISALFWCLVVPCWLWLKLTVRHPVVSAAVGILVLLPMWLALVQLQNDAVLLLALLAVVWIADSAAYFTGRKLGRHKLAPAISPGKTWEGVGGAFAAVTVYALLLYALLFSAYELHIMFVAFLGMTCLSIIGDLFESWLKRNAGVKDSGSIFPGHGGMLDRIDGVTAALPLAALVFI